MNYQTKITNGRKLPDAYWLVIGALLIIVTVLLLLHLNTGFAPSSKAFTIPVLNLPVYWYGIWIVGSVALGAYVISKLAEERALELFHHAVPLPVQMQKLDDIVIPDEIKVVLAKRQISTMGDLLLQWGYDPRNLGLNQAGLLEVQQVLDVEESIEAVWLQDAPWRKWNPDHVWNATVWCMIFGVIGARLYHIMTPSPSMAAVGIYSPLDYFRNPMQMINLRNGGLGIYGGLAGGVFGLWIYVRRCRIPLLIWTDLAAVAVSLGQVFARWGNFFNQELYGRPTTLPWAITISPEHRLPAYAEFSQFHPAFLYESLWNLGAFLVLWTLAKRYSRKLMAGELTALYLIFYAIGRSLLETVRLDSRTVSIGAVDLNMAVATLVSIVVAIVSFGWVLIRRRQAK
ncbi:MAG: prolipoprotein diacylglyceryl transferase [Chloroflexi bacterium]|nr:prolipoprotein diacylglyceryl transferase [Chloroflexota bacterium]